MAEETGGQGQTPKEEASRQLNTYRIAVSAAVNFLRSREITNTFASLSLEELIDQQIQLIEGPIPGQSLKLGKVKALDAMYKAFNDSIEGLKATPAESFRYPNESSDANTSRDQEGD